MLRLFLPLIFSVLSSLGFVRGEGAFRVSPHAGDSTLDCVICESLDLPSHHLRGRILNPSIQPEVVQERANQSLFNLEALTHHLKCNLVHGGVQAAAAFAAKLDPSTAFRVAENAIENNFLFIPALVEAAAVGFAAWKAYGVLETCADAYEAYDQGGIDGLTWFVAHEGAVRFAMGRAGKAVVVVGGKAFATAKQAAQALIERNPSLALKVADLGAITRGIELKLAHAMQDYSGGSKKMTPLLNEVHERLGGVKGGSKIGLRGGVKSAKPVKTEQPEVVKKGPQGKDRSSKALVGEYRHVKGHHVHAKKAFEGHVNYDPKKGFCISNEYMDMHDISHRKVTNAQIRLFTELKKSHRPNTIKEHSRIAVEALIEGGATPKQARSLVAQSLNDLRNKGIVVPSTIPWGKK